MHQQEAQLDVTHQSVMTAAADRQPSGHLDQGSKPVPRSSPLESSPMGMAIIMAIMAPPRGRARRLMST